MKSKFIYPFAKIVASRLKKEARSAVASQKQIFSALLQKAKNTQFGNDHHFNQIQTYTDWQKQVPLTDYEAFRPYIDRIVAGDQDVVWPGIPKYFAKTSGTTSGIKYIPISNQSIKHHIRTARNAMFNYCAQARDASIFDGKMIFLSGSPTLTNHSNIPTGRLSGIVNHEIPSYITQNQLPSYTTNCIETWEDKLDKIVQETYDQDMRVISGIPPWVQMYFEKLIAYTGKKSILEIFPNFSLFAHGGVNYKPYQKTLENLVGGHIDTLETYPASEGFFAFQDQRESEDLILNTAAGIFYEFVPLDEIFNTQPTRLSLEEVEIGVDYAIIVNSDAGLWGYNVGDTIRFTSKDPYRLIVSGRIKHFISAFGEHVIAKEVEEAMQIASTEENLSITEFTVAPQVNPQSGEELPYHEWFVEFGTLPLSLDKFASRLNQAMVDQNIYYKDLIEGRVLDSLKIRPMEPNAFRSYMKSHGKLGGQNKVPRLSNDRKIADALLPFELRS